MYNILTGQNVSAQLAPDGIDLSIVWIFLTLNRSYKQKLLSLVTEHALGKIALPAGTEADLIGILRRVDNTETILQNTVDRVYGPVINAVMSMPEAKRGRPPRPKAEKVIRLEPKRKRGRPKGSKDSKPRKPYKKRKAAGLTVTGPDLNGDIRIQHADGKIVKRRRNTHQRTKEGISARPRTS